MLGSSSGLITKSGMVNWYEFLIKPAGQPPRLAFPIAWTLLYASMVRHPGSIGADVR